MTDNIESILAEYRNTETNLIDTRQLLRDLEANLNIDAVAVMYGPASGPDNEYAHELLSAAYDHNAVVKAQRPGAKRQGARWLNEVTLAALLVTWLAAIMIVALAAMV